MNNMNNYCYLVEYVGIRLTHEPTHIDILSTTL